VNGDVLEYVGHAGAVHLIRQRDVGALGLRARTLCGRVTLAGGCYSPGITPGDSTITGISATCADCRAAA
jgi:hypothetical protein